MKNMKKILVTVVAALLLMTVTVMGTLAYLTSTSDEVKNTFTVGKVAITLDETDVKVDGTKDTDERVTANEYKLMPGHTYTKDPTVHLQAGSEPSYLFVKLLNEIADIEAGTAYKAPEGEAATEPADSTLTIAGQMEKYGWVKLTGTDDIYVYEKVVSSTNDVVNYPVFTTFTIKGDVANATIETYVGKTVKVKAFAIQEDGFTTGNDFQAKAKSAWDAFTTQNKTDNDWAPTPAPDTNETPETNN